MNDQDSRVVRFILALVVFLFVLAVTLVTVQSEIGKELVQGNDGIKFLAVFFSIVVSTIIGLCVYNDWSWMP